MNEYSEEILNAGLKTITIWEPGAPKMEDWLLKIQSSSQLEPKNCLFYNDLHMMVIKNSWFVPKSSEITIEVTQKPKGDIPNLRPEI